MKIEIKIDDTAPETKVIIVTPEMTESVQALVKRLSEEQPRVIAGFSRDTVRLLEQNEILRIYAAEGKVFAATEKDEFTLRLRLYELEERLDKKRFVRISNSEIVNLGKITGFDLSFTGTIQVSLSNGTSTYVSRRYVSKIKTTLGL